MAGSTAAETHRVRNGIAAEYKNLASLYRRVLAENIPHLKGKLLEDFAVEMFPRIQNVVLQGRNVRTKTGEFDLVLRNNEGGRSYWREIGNPVIVECKNWKDRVDTREIDHLVSKLNERCLRAAFLLAPGGLTRDATDRIRSALKDGKFVIPVLGSDLEKIAGGRDPSEVLEDCYFRHRMI